MKGKLAIRKCIGAVFLAIVAWFLIGFVIVPIIQTFFQSMDSGEDLSFSKYASYFADSSQLKAIWNTIKVGLYSVCACGIVGTCLAIYLRFFCKRFKRLIKVLLLAPLMIPSVIVVVAFLQLYGDSGIVTAVLKNFGIQLPAFSGMLGIVMVITYTQYIYFYLNLTTALRFIDADVIDSAKSLGAGPFAIFKTAIWPVVRPAFIVSVLTTFVSSIGAYSAPAIVGGNVRVLSTQIVAAKVSFDMQLASVEVIVLLLIGVVATASLTLLRRYYAYSTTTRARMWNPDVSRLKAVGMIFRIFTLSQLVMIIAPVVAIFYLSFVSTRSIMMDPIPMDFTLDNYVRVFTNARTFKPLSNSFFMALESTLVVAIFVVPVVLISRSTKNKVPKLMEMVMALPWCMPASVIAIGLINEFASPSVFSFGNVLVGTFEILPIAYAISSLPLLLGSTQVASNGIRDSVEEAARSLGANPARCFVDVTLPAIFAGVLSGMILCFVRTVGEYTMSALLYGVYNRPISVSIVTSMQEYAVGISMAYGALIIILCSVLLVALLRLDDDRFAVSQA